MQRLCLTEKSQPNSCELDERWRQRETVIIKMRERERGSERDGAKKFARPLLLQHFVAQGGEGPLRDAEKGEI